MPPPAQSSVAMRCRVHGEGKIAMLVAERSVLSVVFVCSAVATVLVEEGFGDWWATRASEVLSWPCEWEGVLAQSDVEVAVRNRAEQVGMHGRS